MILIISLGITVGASANAEEVIENKDAVSVVTALSIMSYYEDGTFRPDETVTRAEMAAIICRMMTYEEHATEAMGSTVFNDVPADHWASGYINIAQMQGVVTGYGDFNFGPEDKVTYEQAVKMIVETLGGWLLARHKGGYPEGYIEVASREGILKNTECNIGDKIDRQTVATLVFNALETRFAVQEIYSGDLAEYLDEHGFDDDNTILSRYWKIQKWSGNLEKDGENFVLKDAECFEYKGGKLTKVEKPLGDVDFSRIENIEEFAGQEVNAYISMYKDKTIGKHVAYAMTVK